MNHATPQEWQAYVAGTLVPPRYEELEQHLYDCEECLQQYIHAMDSIELDQTADRLPALSAEAATDFTNRTLLAIHEASIAAARSEAATIVPARAPKTERIRAPLFRRPLFQYTVAAAATLLLLSTGVFQNIGKIAAKDNSIGKPTTQLEQPNESFSQRLMERTTSLLDNIQSNRTGGTPRE